MSSLRTISSDSYLLHFELKEIKETVKKYLVRRGKPDSKYSFSKVKDGFIVKDDDEFCAKIFKENKYGSRVSLEIKGYDSRFHSKEVGPLYSLYEELELELKGAASRQKSKQQILDFEKRTGTSWAEVLKNQ